METETIVEKEEMALDLAGSGSRLVSYVIDGIILGVIGWIFNYVSMSVGGSVGSIIAFLAVFIYVVYSTYFFGNGQTPGMMVMNIKLIGTDGAYPVGYGKGFLRWIGMIISTVVIFIGFLWILIDKKNQGWHDKIAGTYVVNK